MKGYINLILKTAAVASCVSVLIITGCQGGNEAAAVKNKSEAKETSIVSEKDREEDIETVVRSNGLTGQDTKDLRNDLERETASDGRRPEVTIKAEPPKDEGRDAGEEDSTTGTDDNDGQSDESVLSVYESDNSAGWDGGMEDDSAVSEYSGSEWYEPDTAGVEAEEGFTDEYSDSGVDESGQSDSGESAVPEPEVSDSEYGEGFVENESEMDAAGVGEPAEEAEETGDGWEFYGTAFITHYCPCELCCGVYSSGYTSSGTWATEGRTVAAGYDIPIGTEVLINGNVYVVEDRGVGDGCFDIFVNDHNYALALGAYYTDVYVRW